MGTLNASDLRVMYDRHHRTTQRWLSESLGRAIASAAVQPPRRLTWRERAAVEIAAVRLRLGEWIAGRRFDQE